MASQLCWSTKKSDDRQGGVCDFLKEGRLVGMITLDTLRRKKEKEEKGGRNGGGLVVLLLLR